VMTSVERFRYPAAPAALVARLRLFVLLALVQVSVEHREPDEEGDADQVLHPFDVLVEIDQREDLFDLTYGAQRLLDHDVHSFGNEIRRGATG
jgi:hypothetical protein